MLSVKIMFKDRFHFAYRAKKSTDHAAVYVLISVYAHLETANAGPRLMSFDFSSCHILAHKLLEMKIWVPIVLWTTDYFMDNRLYLTSRP